MEKLEAIKNWIEAAVPEAKGVEIIPNSSTSGQNSLLVPAAVGREVARFLKEDSRLRFDYASNVTGVDWPEILVKESIKTKQLIDGVDRVIEQIVEKKQGGFLEAVYHLYSMELRHGPLVLRLRTADREAGARLPSLTPVWRGAEFQEREIFDLYGITFEGHPDLRRILMWDGFADHPMRKDYVEPDDYEYEPTAHDEVLAKARRNAAKS